jgi:hypothetical protein
MTNPPDFGVSMRRRSLKPSDILLVGKIEIGRGEPVHMLIRVWCPRCKDRHTHAWCEEYKTDDVGHRISHCTGQPGETWDSYFIGLDPDAKAENRAVLKEFARLVPVPPAVAEAVKARLATAADLPLTGGPARRKAVPR